MSEQSPLKPFKRNNYFYGKLLTVNDFKNEQLFFNEKRYLLNRLIHGTGVLAGLKVEAPEKKYLRISKGVAIDPLGREVVVGENCVIKFEKDDKNPGSLKLPDKDGEYFLCLSYCSNFDEKAMSIANPDTCCENIKEYNYIREHFNITFIPIGKDRDTVNRPLEYLREDTERIVGRVDKVHKIDKIPTNDKGIKPVSEIMEIYTKKYFEEKLGVFPEECDSEYVYLAKVSIEKNSVKVLEQVPYHQYVHNNDFLYDLIKCQLHGLYNELSTVKSNVHSIEGELQAVKAELKTAEEKIAALTNKKDRATGVVCFNIDSTLEPGDSRSCNPIFPGLKKGPLFVYVGLETLNANIKNNEIYINPDNFSMGAVVDKVNGGFRIWFTAQSHFDHIYSITLRWWAFTFDATAEQNAFSITPKNPRIRPKESVIFRAYLNGALTGDVKWEIVEENGVDGTKGFVDKNGCFKAPDKLGVFTIKGTYKNDSNLTDIVDVVVLPENFNVSASNKHGFGGIGLNHIFDWWV